MTLITPPAAPARPTHPIRAWFGFGRTANVLLAYTLTAGLRLSLFGLLFPLYMYRLGYKQDTIGAVSALGAVTTLVGAVPLGLLADRVGRARLYVLSAVLVPLAYLPIVLSSSLGVIIAAYMATNLLATVYWSTNSPLLVGAVSGEHRVRAFAANSFLLWGVGALGAVIGGAIVGVAGRIIGQPASDLTPLRIALGANVALGALGALPLLAIRSIDAAPAERTRAWRFDRRDLRLFGRLLIADVLLSFGGGAIVGFLPLFFQLRYGLTPATLGLLFTFSGVLSGIASLAAPTLARRLGDVRALVLTQAIIAPSVLFTALAPVVWLSVLFEMARQALRGTLDPIYVPFAMTRVPARQRGALGGLYNVTWATGFSLGPLLSGWIQVRAGFAPAFAISAACYIGAAVLMLVFFRGSVPVDEQDVPATA